MNLLILDKTWRDCNAQFRYQGMAGQGVYTTSFMQSLNERLQAGFQLNCIVSTIHNSTYKLFLLMTFSPSAGPRHVPIRLLRILPMWTEEQAPVRGGLQPDGTQRRGSVGILDKTKSEIVTLLRIQGQFRWRLQLLHGWVQAALSSRSHHGLYGHEAQAPLYLHEVDGRVSCHPSQNRLVLHDRF
jgi:hypothetical protein